MSYGDDMATLERDARELLDDEIAAGRIVAVEVWDASLGEFVTFLGDADPVDNRKEMSG